MTPYHWHTVQRTTGAGYTAQPLDHLVDAETGRARCGLAITGGSHAVPMALVGAGGCPVYEACERCEQLRGDAPSHTSRAVRAHGAAMTDTTLSGPSPGVHTSAPLGQTGVPSHWRRGRRS